MKLRTYYIYILMNKYNTVNYIGITNDVLRRVSEHREGAVKGFTTRYQIKKLVYYETCDSAEQAITREKQLKRWRHEWKMRLILEMNPDLLDLYDQLVGVGDPELNSGRRDSERRGRGADSDL